jgi:hypothetical protein
MCRRGHRLLLRSSRPSPAQSERNLRRCSFFAPAGKKGRAAMKITIKKGLLRIVISFAGALIGLPFAKFFCFQAVCVLLIIGWLLYWLIGGFFDMD